MGGKIKSMRLRNDVIDKVQKIATTERRSFSNMVETILLNYLKDLEK